MLDIIVNPISGKGQSLKALASVEAVLKERNVPYTVHRTEHAKHATEITRELNKREHTDLVVLGGDGTLNEVLNGITDFDTINLGIISSGSGNDFIRATDLPNDPVEAINLILKGNVGHMDYIDLGDKRALNCAGAGMDVDTLVRYSQIKGFKGSLRYLIALLITLAICKFHKITLEIDGEKVEKTVFMVCAANGTCIGGGMPISPHSVPDDGKLHIVVVNKIPRLKVLGVLIKFLNGGKHLDTPYGEEFVADSVRIEILDEGKTEIDGEVQEEKVLDAKIVPGKLRVFR